MTSLEVVPDLPGGKQGTFHRGDRLRKARETAGIQVQAMAALLGVDRASITRYERNRGVKHLTVKAYAEHTDFSYEWLQGDDSDEERARSTRPVTTRYAPLFGLRAAA